ncbi:MAG: hypothetical protein HYV14_01050 [Elusimicrobia bacterium]|nr:hypothetical protein [Elusimicrobiota bacterium]
MRVLVLPMLLAAAFAVPARAAGPAANLEAPNFDGARARPEGDLVRAGASTDGRTAEQIAKDEQVKADARARADLKTPTPGPDKEIEPPKPNEWLKSDHIISGVKGAMIGLLVGSLWGFAGMGVGVLIGGLIGYGLSKLTA